MSKDNPKINNQNDIDNYINQLIKQAESEIETLFSRRLKQIRQEIADMFESISLMTYMLRGLNLINTTGSIKNLSE